MTCKDCDRQIVCRYYTQWANVEQIETDRCQFFKNKTDFVEVKHGKWLYWQPGGNNHLWKCSVCGGAIVTPMRFVAKHIAFCEHCGADMREEGVDNG